VPGPHRDHEDHKDRDDDDDGPRGGRSHEGDGNKPNGGPSGDSCHDTDTDTDDGRTHGHQEDHHVHALMPVLPTLPVDLGTHHTTTVTPTDEPQATIQIVPGTTVVVPAAVVFAWQLADHHDAPTPASGCDVQPHEWAPVSAPAPLALQDLLCGDNHHGLDQQLQLNLGAALQAPVKADAAGAGIGEHGASTHVSTQGSATSSSKEGATATAHGTVDHHAQLDVHGLASKVVHDLINLPKHEGH
jgi:hypothetical protein